MKAKQSNVSELPAEIPISDAVLLAAERGREVSARQIRNWIMLRKIQARQLNPRMWMIDRESLVDYLDSVS